MSKKGDFTGEMSVMGRNGDSKYYWNVHKWEEVKAAKEVFDLQRKNGFAAFRMIEDARGEQITEFDPSAGSILFVPPMQGG